MECRNCQLQQRWFVCANCIKNDLRDFRHQTTRFALERDAAVAKATSALDSGISAARARRFNVASIERSVVDLTAALTKLKRDNEQTREKLAALRNSLAERRRNLTAAKNISVSNSSSHTQSSPPIPPSVLSSYTSLASLSSAITRARIGLVQELVQVFGIAHDNTRSHWTIGALILPLPGDMRRYPPDHINAVLTLIIHFINLLAFYLGVKLPFNVTWSKGKLGVGVPYISTTKGMGVDAGGWASWEGKHPLHVSANISKTPQSSASSSPFASITLPGIGAGATSDSSPASTLLPNVAADADSTILDHPDKNSLSSSSSFNTALAMLLYNVAYLAYTQHVDIPLHQVAAGDVLGNLWAVCFGSTGLGRYSHETTASLTPTPCSFPLPRLSPPTRSIPHGQAFTLEFGQVLQAMSRPVPRPATAVHITATTTKMTTSPTASPLHPTSHKIANSPKSKAKRRPSEVSLAKDIVKRRDRAGAEIGVAEEVFEDNGEDEDEWDLL